ncbi:MAG: hypothetical protein ACLPS1_23920 [Streptosporangiaceae bacterium]
MGSLTPGPENTKKQDHSSRYLAGTWHSPKTIRRTRSHDADKDLAMPAFTAYDRTKLAYHVLGDGLPVVCLPGGPMQDALYAH